jgi:hypothetical protein
MSGREIAATDVTASLEPMTAMLGSDGYGLDISVASDRIGLTVVAGPDACKECLVPKEVFASTAVQMLAKSNIEVDPDAIDIVYPADV